MDHRRFDAWVKRLPGATRRGLLRGLAGSAVATVVGSISGEEVAAQQGICGKGCSTLCEARTAVLRCNYTNTSCVCVKSTSGAFHCADSGRSCPAAGSPNECQMDSDCGQNAICIRTADGVCCSDPTEAKVNICMPICLNLTTAGTRHGGQSVVAGVRERLLGR